MKNNVKAISLGAPALLGYLTFMLSGVVMWFFMMYWFLEWWGLLGIIAALLLPPLATLFPFIFWVQESFPLAYILIWLIGIASLIAGFALTGGIARRQLRKATRAKSQKNKYKDAIDGEIIE